MDPKPFLNQSLPGKIMGFPNPGLEVRSPALTQKKTQKSLQVLISAEKCLCPFQVPLQKLCYSN